jgi:hypothetical protein
MERVFFLSDTSLLYREIHLEKVNVHSVVFHIKLVLCQAHLLFIY